MNAQHLIPICPIQEYTNFFARLNYDIIYRLPYENNPRTLADQTSKRLTGKWVLKQNVISESTRLRVHDQCIIDSATDYIWDTMEPSLREKFIILANSANIINLPKLKENEENLDRIARINLKQKTTN